MSDGNPWGALNARSGPQINFARDEESDKMSSVVCPDLPCACCKKAPREKLSYCHPCLKQKNKETYQRRKNTDKYIEYYFANKDKIQERTRKYRALKQQAEEESEESEVPEKEESDPEESDDSEDASYESEDEFDVCARCKMAPKEKGCYCTECMRALNRKYGADRRAREAAKNPPKPKVQRMCTVCGDHPVYRDGKCRGHYNLALNQLQKLRKTYKKAEACEVCGSTFRLCIDHDHTTGEARGTLCNGCNTSLGMTKESISTLMGLVKYIQERCSQTE